jgi:ribosomal protein L16 Arg81 hydroxylase
MTVFGQQALAMLKARYPETAGRFRHGLIDHPLLSQPALRTLAARLSPADIEYAEGRRPPGSPLEEAFSTARSAVEILDSLNRDGTWMVMKFIEKEPGYRHLLEMLLSEIAAVAAPVSGPMITQQGFVFVSARGAVTPLHFDPEHNILLQICGRKRFTVFSHEDEEIAPPQAHERFHLGLQNRNLEWKDRFHGRGQTFDLGPGDALHVPVMAPHWVEVIEGPSISLSITWRSLWSYEEADARGLNHLLRHSGLSPARPSRFPQRNRLKSLAYRALRRTGLV